MTPNEIARERARLEYEARSAEVKLRIENQVKKLEALFKNLTLINGGAIIALFTLLGNLEKSKLALDTSLLWWAFAAFSGGLIFTTVASGMSFQAQYHLSIRAKRQAWNEQAAMFGLDAEHDALSPFERGKRYMAAMWVASLMAMVAFVVGAASAMGAVLPAKRSNQSVQAGVPSGVQTSAERVKIRG